MGKKDNGFLMFYDWEKAFEMLDGKDCKKIIMAMFDYSARGVEPPKFDGVAEMAACFIFPAMMRHKNNVENGRRGGRARTENAASYGSMGEGAEDQPCSAPLEPPLNPPSSPLEPPLTICATPPQALRQDKDKTKTKQNIDYRQDEDKDMDVSSVVGLSKEICKWLDLPTSLSRGLCSMIESCGYGYEDYRRLFEAANECDFLKGKGERGWKASLEWLIEHRDEVTSGKYRTWNNPAASASSSFDTDEFFEAAVRRSYLSGGGDGQGTTD